MLAASGLRLAVCCHYIIDWTGYGLFEPGLIFFMNRSSSDAIDAVSASRDRAWRYPSFLQQARRDYSAISTGITESKSAIKNYDIFDFDKATFRPASGSIFCAIFTEHGRNDARGTTLLLKCWPCQRLLDWDWRCGARRHYIARDMGSLGQAWRFSWIVLVRTESMP